MKLRGSVWIAGVPPKGLTPTPVVFCGTRTFDDQDRFNEVADRLTYWVELVEVVVGGRGKRVEKGGQWHWVGADACAVRWAEYHWYTRHIFWPDWDLGGRAGPIRNTEMARYAAANGGRCVAFWDGKSKGTKDMIAKFLRYNDRKYLRVVRI